MCWQQPPPRAEGSPVSTVRTPELLLKLPRPAPALGEESWLLETSVHTQESHPPPAPLQANSPRASPSGLVHLQGIQCQVLAPLQTLPIPSQLRNPEPGQEGTALGQRFSFPILQIPESLHVLVEQRLLLQATRGDAGMTALGEGLGRVKYSPYRLHEGHGAPRSSTLPFLARLASL